VSQSLHRVIVEGESAVNLNFEGRGYSNSLYLDDLLINEESILKVKDWVENRHSLFVRKDSAHL